MEYINEQYDPAMSWKDAEYCIKRWGGPFAIKGLMSVEDAKRAVDMELQQFYFPIMEEGSLMDQDLHLINCQQ